MAITGAFIMGSAVKAQKSVTENVERALGVR